MAARLMLALATLLLMTSAAFAADAPPKPSARKSTVGKPARIEQIILPGSALEAKRIDSREVPLVLRVVGTYPHGTAFRYDLEYYGLEPGQYDLRDYLKRKDGSSLEGLPPLPVEVASLLPPGQVLPSALEAQRGPRLGGYRLLLGAAVVVWIAGLIAILVYGRRRRRDRQQHAVPVVSLADRLRPLVSRAMEGHLDSAGQAEIERLLLTYWRRRLNLTEADPVSAVATLRAHDQAGVLLRHVEAWLHKPEGAGEVDLQALLAPYRDLPAELPSDATSQVLEPVHGGGRP